MLIRLTSAAAPLIAAELGHRAHAVREVRRTFRMALWVGTIFCAPAMLVLWLGEPSLLFLGQDATVARGAGGLLRILVAAVPLAVAAGVMRTTAAALGRPGWTFLVTGLALALDLLAIGPLCSGI